MPLVNRILACAFSSCLLFSSANAVGDENLAEILRNAKWDGIVGTWVDENTNGKSLSSTFSWKIKNRVLENSSRQGKEKEDVSLIGVNAKTGQIYNMSAGSDGGSSLGEWKFSASGEASLGILYTAGTGQEGALSIRYRLVNQDTLEMTVDLPQPITYRLIRAKEKTKQR